MQVRVSQIFKKVVCLTIISLTLWLGGFGCSTCCASDLGKAQADNEKLSFKEKPSSTESTSSIKYSCHESNCCQQPLQESAATSPVIDPNISLTTAQAVELHLAQETGVVGCSLLPKNAQGITSSSRLMDGIETVAATTIPAFPLLAQLRDAEFARPLFPQNRSGTHLQCCVFLI